MNQQTLVLMGRATRDAETLTTKTGKEFSKFGMAINEYRGQDRQDEVSFYDVVGFSNQTKVVGKRVRKGDVVLVFGKPEASAYQSKDGELKANFSVSANYINLFSAPEHLRKANANEESLDAEDDSEQEL